VAFGSVDRRRSGLNPLRRALPCSARCNGRCNEIRSSTRAGSAGLPRRRRPTLPLTEIGTFSRRSPSLCGRSGRGPDPRVDGCLSSGAAWPVRSSTRPDPHGSGTWLGLGDLARARRHARARATQLWPKRSRERVPRHWVKAKFRPVAPSAHEPPRHSRPSLGRDSPGKSPIAGGPTLTNPR
jgi:hypothetical protein